MRRSQNRCGGPGIFPAREINFRPASRVAGDGCGRLGIASRHDACGYAFAQDFKHNSSVSSGVREIEAFVDDREVRDDVAQDGFA